MATQTTTVTAPGRKILTLDSSHGKVYREISSAPPRAATAEEIPIIDLSEISSKNLEDRRSIALKIKAAAENTGFFYIENHGVDEGVIENAKTSVMESVVTSFMTAEIPSKGRVLTRDRFMAQPLEVKQKVARKNQKYWNGYFEPAGSQANKSESRG